MTATTTDPTGGTSEFSAPSTVKDGVAPTVEKILPAANATGVAPGTNVSASYSEAMKSSSINTSTFKLRKAGTSTSVAASVTYDAATRKATLNPNASLTRGTTYVATVSSDAKDPAGNALDQRPGTTGNQSKVWRFTITK